MAIFDVAHIDIVRYRELRRLVLDGRANALIVVYYAGDVLLHSDEVHDAKAVTSSTHKPQQVG